MEGSGVETLTDRRTSFHETATEPELLGFQGGWSAEAAGPATSVRCPVSRSTGVCGVMRTVPPNGFAVAAPSLHELSFRELIARCCVSDEATLRRDIKSTLLARGFSFVEDDYVSYRSAERRPVSGLCNLLLTRGAPRVALVAHTDVCRDHDAFERGTPMPVPDPVIQRHDGRTILRDRHREVQLGGDDRLGVAIALWTALRTKRPLALLFTTDEEVGLLSAATCRFAQLATLDLLVQIDRGNHSHQLVDRIHEERICAPDVATRILAALERAGRPRETTNGGSTDVRALRRNGVCRDAINLTCGYHESYGDSGDEYIDLPEAEDTARDVRAIVQEFSRVRRARGAKAQEPERHPP